MPLLRLIPIGERLLSTLEQTGWIERSSDDKSGHLFRITEAGRTAFRTRVPIR
jgi:DNA-binding MarR family transcriptional regulator